jgi:hypothetical protein
MPRERITDNPLNRSGAAKKEDRIWDFVLVKSSDLFLVRAMFVVNRPEDGPVKTPIIAAFHGISAVEARRSPACFSNSGDYPMAKIQSASQAQLRAQAYLLRQEADTLPRGSARDGLLQRAQGLEREAILEGWASCAELQPPRNATNETHHNSNIDAPTSPRTHKAS